ncbi:MAG: hypothetical protein ACI9Z9_002744, partial [Litorivivens sp.]
APLPFSNSLTMSAGGQVYGIEYHQLPDDQ